MRNSLILAALAADAVPNIGFRDVKELTNDLGGSIDAALLTGSDGNHYVIRQGANEAAALELATEVAALNVIGHFDLPFKVSKILGETRLAGQRPAVVFEYVYGTPVDLERTKAGDPLADSIGNTISAIHNLSAEAVTSAGFAEFSPAETVKQRISELDRLAATGKIPKVLLDRWSEALENVSLFRYTPTVVHSNLNSVNLLELDGAVSGVLAWHGLKVGDPAEDFAALAATGNHELMDAVRFAYLANRKVIDPNISQRAHLYAEMHMGRWLLHGVNTADEGIIAEGLGMLNILVDEIASGDAPLLTAGSFAKSTSSFVEATEESEPELVVVQETRQIFVDDATREIELPEKTDDELF